MENSFEAACAFWGGLDCGVPNNRKHHRYCSINKGREVEKFILFCNFSNTHMKVSGYNDLPWYMHNHCFKPMLSRKGRLGFF